MELVSWRHAHIICDYICIDTGAWKMAHLDVNNVWVRLAFSMELGSCNVLLASWSWNRVVALGGTFGI